MEKTKSLIGRTFGKLKVLQKADDHIYPNGKRRAKWLVLCSCGKTKPFSVISNNLLSGTTKSCGCYNIQRIIERRFKDLTGKTFGMMLVLSRAKDYIDPKSKNKLARYYCSCECGNKKIIRASELRSGKTISCGCAKESIVATKLKRYFQQNFPASLLEYKILKNPETSRYLPFDIYIPSGENKNINGYYIEVNGEQHYTFSKKFYKTEEEFKNRKKLDRIKRKFARKNGIYIEVDLRKEFDTDEILDRIKRILNP